jgi:hypothetical protein
MDKFDLKLSKQYLQTESGEHELKNQNGCAMARLCSCAPEGALGAAFAQPPQTSSHVSACGLRNQSLPRTSVSNQPTVISGDQVPYSSSSYQKIKSVGIL